MARFMIFLLFISYISIAAAASSVINQVWWSKYTGKKVQNGCSGMCCSGRDSNCFSYGPRMGGKTSANGQCFCDEGCLNMEDCCEDYSVQCQAVDCIVDEWEDYEECNRHCGIGMKTRYRKVIQQPKNGGQECPTLSERTTCLGTKCKSQRHLGKRGRSDLETARIMPAFFGKYRDYKQYNAHLDYLRKNLFYRYYSETLANKKGYCAKYEVTSSRVACSNPSIPWINLLQEGQTVCVECHVKAMDGELGESCLGHGNTEKDTYWTAVNAQGCHGWWRRVSELEECSCQGNQGLDFIFV